MISFIVRLMMACSFGGAASASNFPSHFRMLTEEEGDNGLPEGALSLEELFATFQDVDASLFSRFTKLSATKLAMAIMSFVCSSILIWMIRRSHNGLSTTQHRILVGLSLADIANALGHIFSNVSNPSEMNYIVWGAHGTDASCITNGFFTTVGFVAAPLYNWSLNLYYLVVVRYSKNEEYIRKKLEPFFHGFPIAVASGLSITLLVNGNYNSDTVGNCTGPVNNAPHCTGYEDGVVREGFEVPCGRGRTGGPELSTIYLSTIIFATPVVIIGSLALIYWSVLKSEKKLSKYGSGALKKRLALRQESTATKSSNGCTTHGTNDDDANINSTPGFGARMKKMFSRTKPEAYAKNAKSRVVMHKAIAYSISWFLTYIFLYVLYFKIPSGASWELFYLNTIFTPLQGLYNLLIYLYPIIVSIKNKSKRRKEEKLTWMQAFLKAFWSKGGEQRSNSKIVRPQNKKSKLRKKKQRRDDEEEKTEVQAAGNSDLSSSVESVKSSMNECNFARV